MAGSSRARSVFHETLSIRFPAHILWRECGPSVPSRGRSGENGGSSGMAVKNAGSMAIQDAAKKAKPVLLEPIMSVEVVAPEEYIGDVIGDINSRRGRIEGMEVAGHFRDDVKTAELVGQVVNLIGCKPAPQAQKTW